MSNDTTEVAVAIDEILIEMAADLHQTSVIIQSFLVIVGILLACLIVRWLWRRVFKFALSFIKF